MTTDMVQDLVWVVAKKVATTLVRATVLVQLN
jgi:hypothetical protein